MLVEKRLKQRDRFSTGRNFANSAAMVGFLALWMGFILQRCQAIIFTNDWAIRISGDHESVDRIADKYGFTNMGQIGDLENHYSFRHNGTAKWSTVSNRDLTALIAMETKVEWLQQQEVHRRAKRNSRASHIYSIDIKTKHASSSHPPNHSSLYFNDPQWNSLWYIHCSNNSKGCQSHMNIEGAWRRGYTGKGVVVSVLDDGIEREHPDLKPNYDPNASYDVNGNDQDPSPCGANHVNYHGTECAGMVAAAANNSQCIVGVAFHARIGGIRMLDGNVTDLVEAQALSFRPQHIDVYSASWGPEDDGTTLEGPGPLARLALHSGIQTGRGGRGSVYVWASGNGGRQGDHCSCDGYTNSIYTISVSSGTQGGGRPEYLEKCSSTLATAYSGGQDERSSMVTLGRSQGCSRDRSGTSLSSPMAAGVIALALDANPLLTWRDVQHIIVRTSQSGHLSAPDWHTNGAGYKVSHLYGFGLLDAESMVKEAVRWRQAPPQHMCEEEMPLQLSRPIRPGSVLKSVFRSTGCSGYPRRHVAYVEHVVARVTIAHRHRGDLSITLASPAGTKSQLLANRPLDHSSEGFVNWEFMTTHCWGEEAAGEWSLEIQSTPSHRKDNLKLGTLKDWSLVLYGTSEQPRSTRREQARSVETPAAAGGGDLAEEYSGPCDPECSADGCEGPGPQLCVTCLHFFLKFKNNTRTCVVECPTGFWGDRRRCKRCFSSCESCTGSRSDQCVSCQPGFHFTEGTNTCSAACREDHYLDHEANTCRKCSENCLKCTSLSICTECKPGTSLQGNQCQRSCGSAFYHSKQDNACLPCHEACATCAGAGMESCQRCAEGYLMENWRCVSSCGAGFYAAEPGPDAADSQGMCRRCDASCLTCVGPGRRNCSSCSGGHGLQEGVCVVSTVCGDGEYQGEDGACRACDPTCVKCAGPGDDDCTSCGSSRALDEGHCVLECAKGAYLSGGQCHLCDRTCASCVDAGPANCTSCGTDKFGIARYLHQGQCVDTCPDALYHTQDQSCEPCSDHCMVCISSARCLKCNSSYYLSEGACAKLECGEGEVEDPDLDDCMACEQGCKKCVLYNPRHCLSCTEGFYNFQDGCYRNCPPKTYSVEEEMTCVACDDSCANCDEHECYWCETDLFLSEGKCVALCPDGFYGDEETRDCEECHSDCVTCGGPEDDECLSCEDGKTLEGGECVSLQDACPVQTFRTGEDGQCEECHPSCESCFGEEKNQCKSCVRGRFLSTQQTCVAKCSAGTFANRLSGACEACPQGCVQCVDAQHCTRCQATPRKAPLFLQDGQCVQQCVRGYAAGQVCRSCTEGCASCWRNATHCLSCLEPLFLHNHQCVEACPPAHSVHDGECQHCPPACQECTLLGECTGCEEYHFLHEGSCVPDCPESFFEDAERGACLRCHPDCSLCDGPDHNDCDTCSDPAATLHNGQCLTQCPSHTYRDTMTAECEDCHSSCLTCSGPHAGSCSSCREGHHLDGHGHCGPQTSKCPSRHYADQQGECHPCHKYCHQCSGPGKTHCLSCHQQHVLLNGTCMDECPAGYYQDDGGQTCEPCHPACLACMGKHSNECLACKAHLFREAKECVETCQPSYYGNAASRVCERCDPSCGECLGGGEGSCLSCARGLLYLRKESRCLRVCPEGYHRDAAHGTCEPCHASCHTCSGRDSHACDSCYFGYTHNDGMCESMCSVGQYPVQKGSGHACEDCDGSCVECRGPGPANCTTCPAQAILAAGGRCLLCCQPDSPAEEEEGEATGKTVVNAEASAQQQDCCNCTETRGECVLSTNLAFRNEEEEEARGNLVLFIMASILLVLGLAAVVVMVRHTRSKRPAPELAPRGYEKLGSGGSGGFGGGKYTSSTSTSTSYAGRASSSGSHLKEAQLVDVSGRQAGLKDEDEDDEDDEDIVYMGQDGTVYRKFRYGQLGDDNEDELEYDDESYTFR